MNNTITNNTNSDVKDLNQLKNILDIEFNKIHDLKTVNVQVIFGFMNFVLILLVILLKTM